MMMLFTIIVLICIAAHSADSTQFAPTIVSTDRADSCLSASERGNTLAQIRENVSAIVDQLAPVPQCGEGLWYRVAYLDFNDSSQDCPSSWKEIAHSGVRACGRPDSQGPSCPSANLSVNWQYYSAVCGKVIGYQVGSTDAFLPYQRTLPTSVDDNYVDGVSITHGRMPREHIWTLASGATEGTGPATCPCSNSGVTLPPNFIGNDYFCETGNSGVGISGSHHDELFEEDPLWDGKQCDRECCSNGKSPPWFRVDLSSPTNDDIEVRICADEGTNNEDTLIQTLELYIQ